MCKILEIPMISDSESRTNAFVDKQEFGQKSVTHLYGRYSLRQRVEEVPLLPIKPSWVAGEFAQKRRIIDDQIHELGACQ